MMANDFSPATVRARIMASIQPVLDKADAYYDHYRPLSDQVIGKHHPLYDTLAGKLSYLQRQLSQFEDKVEAQRMRHMERQVAAALGAVPIRYTLGVGWRDPEMLILSNEPVPLVPLPRVTRWDLV